MAEDQPEVIHVGDRIRMSVKVLRELAELNAGLRSPTVRVVEIRRDADGSVELIVEA
jgi:hypothetical protein